MIRHFTHQLFSYGFVAYKQCKSLNFVFSPFLMSQYVARSYWKLKGFMTGFHIYTSTFSVKSFSLSKKVFGEHLFIGQQQNGANNFFDINCHILYSLYIASLPSIKGQLNNNNNININNDNNTELME